MAFESFVAVESEKYSHPNTQIFIEKESPSIMQLDMSNNVVRKPEQASPFFVRIFSLTKNSQQGCRIPAVRSG